MNDTKTINRLSQEIEELTEMLNRVRSVIRGNLAVNLDPSGELQMTREEYAAHWEKINAVSAEHEQAQAVVDSTAEMSAEQIEKVISGIETNQLCNALSGLGAEKVISDLDEALKAGTSFVS